MLAKFFFDPRWLDRTFTPVTLAEKIKNIGFWLLGIAPRYQTKPKLEAIKAALARFGDVAMSSLPQAVAAEAGRSPNFVITAFNYDDQRAAFFRSNLASLAASSAPALNPTLRRSDSRLVDRAGALFRSSCAVCRQAFLGRRHRWLEQSDLDRRHRSSGGGATPREHRGAVDGLVFESLALWLFPG